MFAGLCGNCRHHTWIESGRGSRFLRCELSFVDSRFPKYPPLPVLSCAGYEPKAEPGSGKEGVETKNDG
jgi:hypothetical protein